MKIIIVSLIGLLLFSYQSVSSAQTGALKLNVTDESGKPVDISFVSVGVKIEVGENKVTRYYRFPTTTDSQGHLLVEGLPYGTYRKLKIHKTGYCLVNIKYYDWPAVLLLSTGPTASRSAPSKRRFLPA